MVEHRRNQPLGVFQIIRNDPICPIIDPNWGQFILGCLPHCNAQAYVQRKGARDGSGASWSQFFAEVRAASAKVQDLSTPLACTWRFESKNHLKTGGCSILTFDCQRGN